MNTKNTLGILYIIFAVMVLSNLYIAFRWFSNNDLFNVINLMSACFASGFSFGLIFTIKQIIKDEKHKEKLTNTINKLHE